MAIMEETLGVEIPEGFKEVALEEDDEAKMKAMLPYHGKKSLVIDGFGSGLDEGVLLIDDEDSVIYALRTEQSIQPHYYCDLENLWVYA